MIFVLFAGIFVGGAALEAPFDGWKKGFKVMTVIYLIIAAIVGFIILASNLLTEVIVL